MDLHTPAIELKGIGPKTVKSYEKLGLCEAEDFLYYFPRDYMFYEEPVRLSGDQVGEFVFFRATVLKRPFLRRGKRMQVVTATLVSDEQEVSAVWFRMPYLVKSLKAGERYVFRARLLQKGTSYHVEQPLIFTEEAYREIVNTLQPVYALTKGLSNNALIKTIRSVFSEVDLPSDEKDPLFAVHFPKDREELLRARNKLVYEEFFLFLLKLKLLKEERAQKEHDFHIYPTAYTKKIIETLPYALTDAQKRVWSEIENDLSGTHLMSRLIQGDVGSGKTILAVLSSVMVASSGYQVALMAPTEILATQHFEAICAMLREQKIDLGAVLLTGSLTAAQKNERYRMIESGEASLIIGTHALFQTKVSYNNLALVITDEQHRFGVLQRERLSGKGNTTPHMLVMSATPIPRTLAMILYGDLDVSLVNEVPRRRLPIKNCVVNTDYRETAYRFMAKEIKEGRQVYVICPFVEESDGLEGENVLSYTEELREKFAGEPAIRIGTLHGRMKASEKNRVMDAFYRNDIQILVSTTVVEVGVNVPNATVMLIENAERFGLSQLHQLRGRIGRGEYQSYCIFMTSSNRPETMERLSILNKSNDGFEIANEDLKMRGPGELFGIRQSGDLNFMLGDIIRDADVLKKAAEDVSNLLSDDPELEKKEHHHIRKKLDEMDARIHEIL